MKLIIRNSLLFFLILVSTILITTNHDRIYAFVYEVFDKNKGVLSIVSVDAKAGYPISEATFQLIDLETNKVVHKDLVTNLDGIVRVENIPLSKSYQIVQTEVKAPYQVITEPKTIELLSERDQVTFENSVFPSVNTYKRTDKDEIVVTEMNLPVETIMQKPELPNGCEVTTLASVLHYYGYEVEKTVLADDYLPKVPFEVNDGKLYGANPNKAYAGDPRSKNQGFYSYVPPIMETANKYFGDVNGIHKPHDLTGTTPEKLLEYIREGIPVIVWTTINQKDPLFDYSWIIRGTKDSINVIRNSHTVVLTGYSETEVYVMDPLKGNIAYPKERFFEIYEKAGSHAMVIR
ncbi:C39 family peptidase [Paucisalibacillus sp. EB02]|uniref:C39 family peptidase n=1 Tax=Paucisalibacillus sp. EB02 TaxID=1347087 RepID=UPI0004BCDDD1|nr:C39 family peptidase [Paucisalibacillus sp. EB02]